MRRKLKIAALLLALSPLAYVVLLNMAIAVLGGSRPSPVSLRRLPEKKEALNAYFRHWTRRPTVHLFGEPDPRPLLEAAARRHGLPSELVLAVAKAESDFRPHRISSSAAMGVMQLMPSTARDMGVSDPFDVEENTAGGVAYLAWLWRRYDGNLHRVIAAYNAGPGVVPRSGVMELPGETRLYVRRVLAYKAGNS